MTPQNKYVIQPAVPDNFYNVVLAEETFFLTSVLEDCFDMKQRVILMVVQYQRTFVGRLGLVARKLVNSLMMHAGSTRFPLMSIMADTEGTRGDMYPHLNIFHAV
jgi:hypothetical protein